MFKKLLALSVSSAVLAPALTFAQETADVSAENKKTAQVESIVVYGERVVRDIQNTASSVAVIRGELADLLAGKGDVNDALFITPNISQAFGQDTPVIRGQNSAGTLTGSNALLGGTRARATYVIDGRPVDLLELTYGAASIWDLYQIEVFRGPQTTNQGLNSIAGSVYVKTEYPEYEFSGRVRGVVGEQDLRHFSAMMNAPIKEDEIALRISADFRAQEADAIFVPQNIDDNDLGFSEAVNIRARLLLEPDSIPDLRAVLTYGRVDSNGPQSLFVTDDFETVTNANFVHWDVTSNYGILDIDYDLGDGFAISTLLTGTKSNFERRADPRTGRVDLDADIWSSETTVSYNDEGPLSGILGFYLYERDETQFLDVGPGVDITGKEETLAFFGEVTFQIMDKLSLTGGGRYQRDKLVRDAAGFGQANLVEFDETYNVFLPKATLQYDLNDEISFGFTTAKGYTPGGSTLNLELFAPDFFDQETLWSHELFFRALMFDQTLRLNANVFYSDFKDTQRGITFAVGGDPDFLTTVFANAEKAESIGAEIELEWKPNADIDILAGIGILDTELKEYSELANFEFFVGDPIGNEFQRAPNFTATFATSWRPVEGWQLDVQGRYESSYFSDDLNFEDRKVSGYFLADARVSYTTQGLEFFVYASNIFDKQKFIDRSGFFDGVEMGHVNEARQIGAGIDVKF